MLDARSYQELQAASLESQVMEEELCHSSFKTGEGSDVEEDDVTKFCNQTVLKNTGIKCSPNQIFRPIFPNPVSHSSAAKDHAAVSFVHRPKVIKKVPNIAEHLLQDADKPTDADVLQTLIASLKGSVDCPKLELLKFNEDPISCHRFILIFTSTIEGTVSEKIALSPPVL